MTFYQLTSQVFGKVTLRKPFWYASSRTFMGPLISLRLPYLAVFDVSAAFVIVEVISFQIINLETLNLSQHTFEGMFIRLSLNIDLVL